MQSVLLAGGSDRGRDCRVVEGVEGGETILPLAVHHASQASSYTVYVPVVTSTAVTHMP